MKFNVSLRRILITGLLVILVALVIWAGFGGDFFTKTQVLIEREDELLGTTYLEWKDKFILGLDYTLAFVLIAFIIMSIALFIKRDKK